MADNHRDTFVARRAGARGERSQVRHEPASFEQAYGLIAAIPRVTGRVVWLVGVLALVAGLTVWLGGGDGTWESLAGAVAIDLGGTLLLLGLEARAAAGRLSLSPLTGLLTVYALRRFLGLTYILGERDGLGSPFEMVPPGGYVSASATAEFLTLLGTTAFFLGWRLSKGGRREATASVAAGRWQARQLWVAYFVGLAVFLTDRLIPGAIAPGGALLSATADLALGAIFALLVFNGVYGIATHRHWLVLAAVAPLLATALTWGMKSGFVLPLVPVVAAYALRKPTRAFGLTALGVGGLLLFVFPYVKEYRYANWGDRPGGMNAGEIAQSVSGDVRQEGIVATVTSSFQKLEERFGSVNEAGAVVFFADTTGHVGAFFLKTLPYAFIPRFLWPGKPSWDPSAWFTAYLSGFAKSEAAPGSATALHVAAELYWMMGWPATFFGMLVVGLYYRRVSDFLLRQGAQAPVFLASWFGFLLMTALVEEVRFVTVLVGPVIIIVNAYAVQWVIAFLTSRAPRRHYATASGGGRPGRGAEVLLRKPAS